MVQSMPCDLIIISQSPSLSYIDTCANELITMTFSHKTVEEANFSYPFLLEEEWHR